MLFQSTLPYGSDGIPTTIEVYTLSLPDALPISIEGISNLFQSTLPHGSDTSAGYRRSNNFSNFNPRSLTGATNVHKTVFYGGAISIHAPSRERPLARCSWLSDEQHFNPRSLTGATQFRKVNFIQIIRFQSTLPHGSDDLPTDGNLKFTVFQSTLPHGSDPDSKFGSWY